MKLYKIISIIAGFVLICLFQNCSRVTNEVLLFSTSNHAMEINSSHSKLEQKLIVKSKIKGEILKVASSTDINFKTFREILYIINDKNGKLIKLKFKDNNVPKELNTGQRVRVSGKELNIDYFEVESTELITSEYEEEKTVSAL